VVVASPGSLVRVVVVLSEELLRREVVVVLSEELLRSQRDNDVLSEELLRRRDNDELLAADEREMAPATPATSVDGERPCAPERAAGSTWSSAG
jgi:hypothetical protein